MLRTYLADIKPLEDYHLFRRGLALVGAERRQKVNSMAKPRVKQQSLGAGLLLLQALWDAGLSPQQVKNISIGMDEFQKPYLIDFPQIYYNLSHSADKVMAVMGDGPVGCDIQASRPIDISVIKRFCHHKEYEWLMSVPQEERPWRTLQLWTLKESYVKARGKGIAGIALDSFCIEINQAAEADNAAESNNAAAINNSTEINNAIKFNAAADGAEPSNAAMMLCAPIDEGFTGGAKTQQYEIKAYIDGTVDERVHFQLDDSCYPDYAMAICWIDRAVDQADNSPDDSPVAATTQADTPKDDSSVAVTAQVDTPKDNSSVAATAQADKSPDDSSITAAAKSNESPDNALDSSANQVYETIITVPRKCSEEHRQMAEMAAEALHLPLVERYKQSVNQLRQKYNATNVMLVKDGQFILEKPDSTLFFHPSMAHLRLKNIRLGKRDNMIEAMGLTKGMSVLDCTLGFGADAIVASFVAAGDGLVTGIESSPLVHFIVSYGLAKFHGENWPIQEAMRWIRTAQGDYLDYLRQQPDNSFDIVYFDPMFRHPLEQSSAMNALRGLANHSPVPLEAIAEAKRVARRRVVMKETAFSQEFQRLGFQELSGGKWSKIKYGIINV